MGRVSPSLPIHFSIQEARRLVVAGRALPLISASPAPCIDEAAAASSLAATLLSPAGSDGVPPAPPAIPTHGLDLCPTKLLMAPLGYCGAPRSLCDRSTHYLAEEISSEQLARGLSSRILNSRIERLFNSVLIRQIQFLPFFPFPPFADFSTRNRCRFYPFFIGFCHCSSNYS
ncbi:unnamed protein product [Urochloa humidicola]